MSALDRVKAEIRGKYGKGPRHRHQKEGVKKNAKIQKAQQRFFGMVRATQKGEMASPSSEVSKAAASMSKSDVKKFNKTKHKGLPNKVEVEEGHKSCKAGYYYCYTDKKCKPNSQGIQGSWSSWYARKENGHTVDDDSETKNGKKNGNGNGNGNGGNGGGMSEEPSTIGTIKKRNSLYRPEDEVR